MRYEVPPFFNLETFNWTASGYQLAEEPHIDLLDPHCLESDNPWIVLGAVLERAKLGKFESLLLLPHAMEKSTHPQLWSGAAELLGDAGSAETVRSVLRHFHDQLYAKDRIELHLRIATLLHQSCFLWAVPVILEMYLRTPNREYSAIMTMFLADLLGRDGPSVLFPSQSDQEYHTLVMEKYAALCRYSVRTLAERLYADLTSPGAGKKRISVTRHFFEAATGINCSDFFVDKKLQPLTAAARVEEFLESSQAKQYEEGVRYFFSHRIPD